MESMGQMSTETPVSEDSRAITAPDAAVINDGAARGHSANGAGYTPVRPTTEEHEMPTKEIDERFLRRVGEEMRRHRLRLTTVGRRIGSRGS